MQFRINENAAAVLARRLLQRQGDQVAEAALGHRVLIGKQAVVGLQLQLPGSRAGVADDGRAQATGIAGRHPASEKHPGVRPFAGARNLEGNGHAKFATRLHEGAGVLSPLGFVEIDGEEIAGVVLQQGIDTDRVLTGQMVVDEPRPTAGSAVGCHSPRT